MTTRPGFFALFPLVVALLPSCESGQPVRVLDAVTGKPVPSAQVTPVFPSFNGSPVPVSPAGVAKVKTAGKAIGFIVEAPGYRKAWQKPPAADPVRLIPESAHP